MILIPILIYIIILLIIFILKPAIMFDISGKIRTYSDKSIITLDIIYPILAIISYYIYLIIKIIVIN